MRVVFHEEALAETLGSALYYEERLEGLGWDFLTLVEQATQRITEFPEAGPVMRGDVRKRLVAGFPFTVLVPAWGSAPESESRSKRLKRTACGFRWTSPRQSGLRIVRSPACCASRGSSC